MRTSWRNRKSAAGRPPVADCAARRRIRLLPLLPLAPPAARSGFVLRAAGAGRVGLTGRRPIRLDCVRRQRGGGELRGPAERRGASGGGGSDGVGLLYRLRRPPLLPRVMLQLE